MIMTFQYSLAIARTPKRSHVGLQRQEHQHHPPRDAEQNKIENKHPVHFQNKTNNSRLPGSSCSVAMPTTVLIFKRGRRLLKTCKANGYLMLSPPTPSAVEERVRSLALLRLLESGTEASFRACGRVCTSYIVRSTNVL